MLEFAQIETGQLADLLEAVYERVSVNEQLARCLGNVQVVFKEALDCHQRLAVKTFERALLEHLLQEHIAESGRKLIDKTTDAEILIAYDILFGVEYLANLNCDLRFLERAREIFNVVDRGADANRYLRVEFPPQCVGDVLRDFLDFLHVKIRLDFLDEHYVMLADADDIVLVLVREHILHHVERNHIALAEELD